MRVTGDVRRGVVIRRHSVSRPRAPGATARIFGRPAESRGAVAVPRGAGDRAGCSHAIEEDGYRCRGWLDWAVLHVEPLFVAPLVANAPECSSNGLPRRQSASGIKDLARPARTLLSRGSGSWSVCSRTDRRPSAHLAVSRSNSIICAAGARTARWPKRSARRT
jgi:hypothetical protein